MKKVIIYPVKEMLYDKVLSFVRQHAPHRYQYLNMFYKREDRYNSAVAYVLLCIAYDQIIEEFEIGKFGKPYFAESNQFLSISHAKSIVSIAASDNEIAIDCESSQSIDETIVNMTFTRNEKNLVKNEKAKKGNIWTAKEAISKFYNEDWYSYPRTEITFE
ncbi:MAG: 4'-phosphopantetheinyl transferase superfamily protein, partial [Lactococcus lactis]|nr:4'-phosphopantetheinyl transferase superfamily protein [Lactococcus lactis]